MPSTYLYVVTKEKEIYLVCQTETEARFLIENLRTEGFKVVGYKKVPFVQIDERKMVNV